jgi:hypothetical protein
MTLGAGVVSGLAAVRAGCPRTGAVALEQGIGSDFGIELQLVTRIPPAPRGKLQFLVAVER